MDLNRSRINRQDFVDNEIFNLLVKLNPSQKEIFWNIEIIGKIRDIIENYFVYDLNACKDEEFY
jgi:hypothetical protein